MRTKQTGKVTKWFDEKGYGFIQGEDGISYFAHNSSINTGRIVKKYKQGDEVEFDAGKNDKGACATNIDWIKK